jgi:tRNA (mo5U34)-methyltransferase
VAAMNVPPPSMESQESINWFHQIELPGGTITQGQDRSAEKLLSLRMPDLAGKSVLDVGAWDGYFSFAAERLGAARVVALDTFMWQQQGGKAGFEYARSALGSKVEDIELEVLDISPETVGKFAVVLFLGVLYHMRHPLLSLERIASVTNELAIIETLTDLTFMRRPAAAFYPDGKLNDDSNWWGPNNAAVLGMLTAAGFARFDAYPSKRFKRLAKNAKTAAGPIVASAPKGSRGRMVRDVVGHVLTRNRLVVHAWM